MNFQKWELFLAHPVYFRLHCLMSKCLMFPALVDTLSVTIWPSFQADYKNLINIAAELVDSLENAVRGNMVGIA